jgi:ribosomal protein L11
MPNLTNLLNQRLSQERYILQESQKVFQSAEKAFTGKNQTFAEQQMKQAEQYMNMVERRLEFQQKNADFSKQSAINTMAQVDNKERAALDALIPQLTRMISNGLTSKSASSRYEGHSVGEISMQAINDATFREMAQKNRTISDATWNKIIPIVTANVLGVERSAEWRRFQHLAPTTGTVAALGKDLQATSAFKLIADSMKQGHFSGPATVEANRGKYLDSTSVNAIADMMRHNPIAVQAA